MKVDRSAPWTGLTRRSLRHSARDGTEVLIRINAGDRARD